MCSKFSSSSLIISRAHITLNQSEKFLIQSEGRKGRFRSSIETLKSDRFIAIRRCDWEKRREERKKWKLSINEAHKFQGAFIVTRAIIYFHSDFYSVSWLEDCSLQYCNVMTASCTIWVDWLCALYAHGSHWGNNNNSKRTTQKQYPKWVYSTIENQNANHTINKRTFNYKLLHRSCFSLFLRMFDILLWTVWVLCMHCTSILICTLLTHTHNRLVITIESMFGVFQAIFCHLI